MKKKHIILALKILFILSAFAFVFWKADTSKIFGYIKSTNPLYLVFAYVIMTCAQILSACRMRFYYSREGLELSRKFSIGLYLTCMLFNTVLPGGIGGDGYKIYTIGKFTKFPRLKAFRLAVSERASGLFALLLLTSIFYIYTDFKEIIPKQDSIIAFLAILLIPSYLISIRILLKEKLKTAFMASSFSFPIQLLNVLIVVVLLVDLGSDINNIQNIISYVVIFMASSVASILPISIGGAGLREITFYYGAQFIGLNAELGIAVALLFFIVNIMCSLNGLLFWHRLERIYNAKA